MTRLSTMLAWLDEESPAKDLPFWIFCSVALFFIYGMILSTISGESSIGISGNVLSLSFVWERIKTATEEELLYRGVLIFPWLMFGRNKIAMLLASLASAYAFALIHADNEANYFIFQGVLGFGLCFIFLKCGGMKGGFYKALLTTTTVHFLYNMAVSIVGHYT